MDNRNVLIVGGDSMVAAHLKKHYGPGVWETSRRVNRIKGKCLYCELSSQQFPKWPANIERVYILACKTNLRWCEENPMKAHLVNVKGIEALIDSLPMESHIIFPSSDFVNTSSQYGLNKGMIEGFLRGKKAISSSILRMTKILWPGHELFLEWAARLQAREPVRAFDDYRFSPIWIDDAVKRLTTIRAPIKNLMGSEEITYEDAARYMALQMAAPFRLVEPAKAGDCGVKNWHAEPSTTNLYPPKSVWDTLRRFCDSLRRDEE